MNAGYREGELTPHMDYTYTPYPADVISLYAIAIPQGGSRTRFYSNVAPLEAMPRSLREEISRYSVFCTHDLAKMKPDVETLICTLQQTERVIELSDETNDDADSRAMLGRIFDDYLYVPENEYIHEWQVGDLVVWDNLALQHARSACPLGRGARTFRRVAVCAAGNAIHDTVAFLDLADSSVAFAQAAGVLRPNGRTPSRDRQGSQRMQGWLA